MSKKVAGTWIIISLLVIAFAVLFLFLSLEFRDRKLEAYSERIRNLEEIVTARQIYRNVIYTEIKENFIVDKRSLFTIEYIVSAGVDLSTGVTIAVSDNAVHISYPYPRILGIDADESSIDEYFSLQRFGKLKQSDYLNIIYDEKERIEEDSLSGGLLERADKNLQNLISGILRESGINNIKFDHVIEEGIREES